MATIPITDPTTAEQTPAAPADTTPAAPILICLPPGATTSIADHLRSTFTDHPIRIAGVPYAADAQPPDVIDYTTARPQLGWVLAAGDYTAAATLAHQLNPSAILLLGENPTELPAATLRTLADTISSGIDLAVPRFATGPHDALVSSALLYPLTRALFSADIRFPLPTDAAISPRLLTRLAGVADRTKTSSGTESLLWPVAEAAVALFSVRQVDSPARTPIAPPETDLNTLLSAVAGSLFADLEAKASFWQRARVIAPSIPAAPAPPTAATPPEDLTSIIDQFRLASANLGEIWSLVLPPQTLLALKKLSRATPETFILEPALWARIAYDFALAFHLRTLNRGHLLGAMTPLYLAWVASHLRSSDDDSARAAAHVEATAQAFEHEKPYFVSRWRWPDRFNP